MAIASRMPRIRTTTRSSMSVKPRERRLILDIVFVVLLTGRRLLVPGQSPRIIETGFVPKSCHPLEPSDFTWQGRFHPPLGGCPTPDVIDAYFLNCSRKL